MIKFRLNISMMKMNLMEDDRQLSVSGSIRERWFILALPDVVIKSSTQSLLTVKVSPDARNMRTDQGLASSIN